MNIFYFALYAVYLVFNALILKLAINWGFDHEIGWKSALLFSLLTSTFALFHKHRDKPQ
jgi:hypothetical protein